MTHSPTPVKIAVALVPRQTREKHERREKRVRAELTEEQQRQIREATGRSVTEISRQAPVSVRWIFTRLPVARTSVERPKVKVRDIDIDVDGSGYKLYRHEKLIDISCKI